MTVINFPDNTKPGLPPESERILEALKNRWAAKEFSSALYAAIKLVDLVCDWKGLPLRKKSSVAFRATKFILERWGRQVKAFALVEQFREFLEEIRG